MSGDVVRAAGLADVDAIRAIWNRAIRETTHTFTSIEKPAEDIHAVLPDMLVLEHAGQVAGFARLTPFRAGPGYSDVAEVTIYLAVEAQGQGRGAALMRGLEDQARRAGHRVLVAGISGDNTGSLRFLNRMGFVKTGHMPRIGQKFGARHDLVLMQKELPPGG